MKLYPYQRQAVDYHKAHHYSLNGSEMGLGKTIMSLTTAKETGNKALVVGPAFLKKTWEDEAEKIGVRIHFVSYSMINRVTVLEASKFNFWIADEVHALKNPTAQRTQAFYSLLKACKPEYFIGMSGTPLKNRVMDLWTLIAFCMQNPKDTSGAKLEGELTKYHAFARHFCNVQELKIRGRRIPKYTTVKDEKIPELKGLLKDKFIRFQVKDVLKDLPAITRKFVPLDIISDSFDDELLDTFEAYATGHKANSTAKRQSALIKSGATIEYCKSLIDGGVGQLLIFTDHVESAQALKAVDPDTKVITGATPMLDRQNAVVAFQEGRIKVIVATIGSMSVGVTLTAANHVVFNDMSWVPSDNMQAEKRVHRIGQGKPCFAHYIESTPTDRYITKTLVAKMDTINKVIE
jgi:SNF2 family DNA or RNA helicase